MKLLVVLLAVAACAAAAPQYGFAYSAYAPYPYHAYPYYTPYAYTPAVHSAAVAGPVVVKDATPVVHTPMVAPMVVKTQYHMQDEFGQARYGFSEPHQTQEVVRDAAGNQAGFFSYINPEGKVVQTSFVADALGYRVASNDLPVAPQPEPVAPVELPTPVEDTPEVAEAKARFMEEFRKEEEKTKSRSRREAPAPVQTPASTAPLTTAVVAPVFAHRAVVPAPVSPLAYSAYVSPVTPYAYSGPYAYSHYAYPGYGYGYPFNYNYVYSK